MPNNITVRYDLQLWQRSAFNQTIAIVRDAAERQTVDLTTGYTARAEMRRRPGTPTLLMSLTSEGADPTIILGEKGEITLDLPASLITDVVSSATWGVELVHDDGTQLIVWGTFSVRASPLQPTPP